MSGIWRELRQAVRSLRQAPVFSAVVILTLGVGVGATATIFAVVNAVLLRPLPFPQPDRIISASQVSAGNDSRRVREVDLVAWREARTLSAIAGYNGTGGVLLGAGDPVNLRGTAANATLFGVLQARPALGRLFRTDEETGAANKVVVLSHALWLARFGGDSQIVGRTITLDRSTNTLTVLGVMPPTFDFPRGTEYWRPRAFDAATPNAVFYAEMIARLAPGATLEQARRELDALTPPPVAGVERPDGTRSLAVMSQHDRATATVARGLWFLFGAVLSLLLVACANVASLMLTRATLRRREFAVRLALGAARHHLARQLLTESLLLAFAGGLLGLLIPVWSLAALVRLSPASVADVPDITVDPVVLGGALALALLAGALFALLPMWQAMREDIARPLTESGARTGSSAGGQRARHLLVVAEIAVALMLVTGGGLMLRSLLQVASRDTGFVPDRVTTATIFLSRSQYPEAEAATRFYRDVMARLRSVPGVVAVAATDALPMKGFAMTSLVRRPADRAEITDVVISQVTPFYFGTLAIEMLEGGGFTPGRPAEGTEVVLNATAARALFPSGGAVGARLMVPVPRAEDSVLAVVRGVVSDVPQGAIEEAIKPQVYFSLDAMDGFPYGLAVRADRDLPGLPRLIRDAVRAIDPTVPVSNLLRLTDDVGASLAPRRFNALLTGAFAALSLFLAALGLYGALAYQVASRRREFGVRLALGSERRQVLSLVLRQGLAVVAVGVTLGMMGSLALSRTLGGLLFEIGPRDPLTFVGAPVLLVATAIVAAVVPAWRAMRTDPIVALRSE